MPKLLSDHSNINSRLFHRCSECHQVTVHRPKDRGKRIRCSCSNRFQVKGTLRPEPMEWDPDARHKYHCYACNTVFAVTATMFRKKFKCPQCESILGVDYLHRDEKGNYVMYDFSSVVLLKASTRIKVPFFVALFAVMLGVFFVVFAPGFTKRNPYEDWWAAIGWTLWLGTPLIYGIYTKGIKRTFVIMRNAD